MAKKKTKSTPMPPPESSRSIWTRTAVLVSFWFVVLFIGIPVWHATTSIYRAPLPLEDMGRWANGTGCIAEFPLLVDVEATGVQDAEGILKTAQHILDDAQEFAGKKPHHLRLRLVKEGGEGSKEENVAAVLRMKPGGEEEEYGYEVRPTSRVVDMKYPGQSGSGNVAAYVAKTLQDIFWQEQQLIEHLMEPYTKAAAELVEAKNIKNKKPKKEKEQRSENTYHLTPKRWSEAEMGRRMSRVVRYAPTYQIAFSLFTGTSTPQSWDIEGALQEYLSPLLGALSHISNFSVSSQVQYYASLTPSVIPTWDEATKSWTLKKEELSSFINSAEWPLASTSEAPTINFILYVPHPSQSPLKIPSSASNNEGFLIPQWGGVVILNPDSPTSHLSTSDLRSPLETFAAQLLALLGAPAHPASLPIRLDSLTRQRSAEVLVAASSTLGSLLATVSNLTSIPIPTTVLDSVSDSIVHLSRGCEELSHGRFKKALEMGRVALRSGEKAFFERTMVAQVYFPDEHKIAVYLPLLGPVGVPLVLALFREIKRFVTSRRGGGGVEVGT